MCVLLICSFSTQTKLKLSKNYQAWAGVQYIYYWKNTHSRLSFSSVCLKVWKHCRIISQDRHVIVQGQTRTYRHSIFYPGVESLCIVLYGGREETGCLGETAFLYVQFTLLHVIHELSDPFSLLKLQYCNVPNLTTKDIAMSPLLLYPHMQHCSI